MAVGKVKPIVITMGEPAGIGPELCLDLLRGDSSQPLVVVGCRKTLEERAAELDIDFSASQRDARMVLDCPVQVQAEAGKPSPQNAAHVLEQLRIAADGCLRGDFSAMVTAPISKEMILANGHAFVGQTEFLADVAGGDVYPVMLLANSQLRVATATTHLPLRDVADALSAELITKCLVVLHDHLPRWFQTKQPPHIRVCGLNPHAGEGGHLGDEEKRIILPSIEMARRSGMDITGPFSADSLYARSLLPEVDCILAMYHDQALPVIKLLDADNTVNVTLGLPFLRVSPAHGTAFDLAGTGFARPHSMRAALDLAISAATVSPSSTISASPTAQ